MPSEVTIFNKLSPRLGGGAEGGVASRSGHITAALGCFFQRAASNTATVRPVPSSSAIRPGAWSR